MLITNYQRSKDPDELSDLRISGLEEVSNSEATEYLLGYAENETVPPRETSINRLEKITAKSKSLPNIP